MAHDHCDHDHEHLTLSTVNRAFIIGIGLNIIFVIIEMLAGLWYDSLALLSDAGHNFSDVIALIMALLAFKLLDIVPSKEYTYGYRRTTILAALGNAILLLVAVGMILWESIARLQDPVMVDGNTTAIVAGIGILINGFTAWLFLKDKDKDLNIKGAYLHMLADTLVSVGVVISGVVILWTQWYWVDTAMSLIIVAVILISTWNLLKDSVKLSLDGVPSHLDTPTIERVIATTKGVVSVHHLHIWGLSTVENALTAHLVVQEDCTFEQTALIKKDIKHQLSHKNIQHITLEVEREGEGCPDPTCSIVQEGIPLHNH
ncbi:MAG: cation diffusion facilitator family transporter [Aureispira sp.]